MNDIYEQLDFVYRQLMEKAHEAREASYHPYSGIAVGAALLCSSGRIYLGANIENASYTPTVCAERVAFFKAINAGEREFVAIAVVGAKEGEEPTAAFPPCGVCRQVMTEFCGPDFVVLVGTRAQYEMIPLDELMPHSFTAKNLLPSEAEVTEEAPEEATEDEYYDDEDYDEPEEYPVELEDEPDEDYDEDDYEDEDYDDLDEDTDRLIDELLDEESEDEEVDEPFEQEFDFSAPRGDEFNFSDEGLSEMERQLLGELLSKLSRGRDWAEDDEDLSDLAALDNLD